MTPESLPDLTREETLRYGRHLILPEVGVEGQKRLKAGSVLLVGAGGLGSPLALYLAAAGVGRIGMVDFDVVDASNLHRQLLHGTDDVGRSKLDSAADTLAQVNPHVEIVKHAVRLDASNVMDILPHYDVVADGTDNFASRYLVNDACLMAKVPNAWGAVFQFEGQASVFGAPGGPCYRCLYPDPPPPGSVPNCAEGGVLGVLPGIIGLLQANEVTKLLLGVGETLSGRLVLFDALAATFREVKLARDPQCPLCGDHPTITSLIDYEGYCGTDPVQEEPVESEVISIHMDVAELSERREQGTAPVVVDVRNAMELQIAALADVVHIPLHEIPQRLEELDADAETVFLCHGGIRSMQAARFAQSQGFARARSLDGGIDRWSALIDPSVPRY